MNQKRFISIAVIILIIIVGVTSFFLLNKKQNTPGQIQSTNSLPPTKTPESENSSPHTSQFGQNLDWKTHEIANPQILYKLPLGLKPFEVEKGDCAPYISFEYDYSYPGGQIDYEQINQEVPYDGIIGFETGSHCGNFDQLIVNGEVEPFMTTMPAWRTKGNTDVKSYYFRYQDRGFRLGLLWPNPGGEELTTDGIDKMNIFFESIARTIQPK